MRRESLKEVMLPKWRKATMMMVSSPLGERWKLTGCAVTHSLGVGAESVRTRLKRSDNVLLRKRRDRFVRIDSGVC